MARFDLSSTTCCYHERTSVDIWILNHSIETCSKSRSHFRRWLIHDRPRQQTLERMLLSHTTVAIGPPFTRHWCNSRSRSGAHSQSPELLQRSTCSPNYWEMQAVAVSSESRCSSHFSNARTCQCDWPYSKQAAQARLSWKNPVQALCTVLQVPPWNCTGLSISPSCFDLHCSWKKKTEIFYRRSVGRPVRAKQDNWFKQELRVLCSRGLESIAQTVSWPLWPDHVTGNFQESP